MAEEQQFKRNIAFKYRIGTILGGNPILEEDKLRFIEINNKRIVRINLIANIIDKYIDILSLDTEIKKSVADDDLEPEKAFLLITLDGVERDIVWRVLFREASTNVNEAKETIRSLLDLKQIKQKGIAEILSSGEISHIISDNKSNKRQRGERICRLIKTMRYPVISKKEDEFDSSCRELGLDNDVRINHSRYFEGDEIRITIKASNEEKLRISIEKLLSNIKNGTFKKIFSIYK